jgi:hypothetical protein
VALFTFNIPYDIEVGSIFVDSPGTSTVTGFIWFSDFSFGVLGTIIDASEQPLCNAFASNTFVTAVFNFTVTPLPDDRFRDSLS